MGAELASSMQIPRVDTGAAAEVLLRTNGVTKRFGNLVAVDGLDLDLQAGEVHGLLGPNGSGKSVTVGMIMGLLRPTSGWIEIFGQRMDGRGHALLRAVGAIIENPAFYPYLSGRDNLRAVALAAGDVPIRRVDDLLDLVGLGDRATSLYQTYSLGMKQRLGIASTLLTDPRIVILDEPANGLDPAGQREVRRLIPSLAQDGRAVLLASHLLHEVQQVCDRVTILRRGRRIESGRVADLLRRDTYLDITIADARAAAGVLEPLTFVDHVTTHDGRIVVAVDPARGAEVTRALAERGHYPAAVIPHESTLEEVFLQLTDEPPASPANASNDGAA